MEKQRTFFDRIMEIRAFETRKEIHNSVLNVLFTGKAYIEFYKVDGTYRKLNCTLNAAFIDESDVYALEKYEIDAEYKYITVYDTDAYSWKKLLVSNITKIGKNELTPNMYYKNLR